MATVITNLLSAIPVFGQDLVELIWGGFNINIEGPYYSYIILKILLDAGKSFYIFMLFNIIIFDIVYFIIQLYNNHKMYIIIIIWNKYSKVKIMITWGQSAVISIFIFLLELTQRLFLNINKIYKINRIFKSFYTTLSNILNKQKYKKNVKGLSYAYLVGLIEGDGWISISKKGKYLTYEIGLELNIRDIQLLYKIKKSLGVGKILTRVRKDINNIETEIHLARYNVRNKQHLKDIFIPILDKYPMLTNKQYDYLRFREALINNIILYDDVPKYTRPTEPIYSVDTILNISYFPAWLIGFIEAEACFSIYPSKLNDINSYVGSFDISQNNSFEIIQAIKQYLNISGNIYQDKTNNFKLKTTSVRNIENIIKFLKHNPIRLLGYKRLQFILFIKKLRKIPRYYNFINIPNNY